jgi:Holliday junction resolvasome RuvABC endonuclease subunit
MTDIYVGIDPGSKNCALVAWSPTDGLLWAWKPKGKMPTGVERLYKLKIDIGLVLCQLSKRGRIARIAMEGYSMYERYGQHASGEVGGVIKLTILLHFGGRGERAYPVLVAPQQLKKFATGNGNTKKELITKEVLKRWDIDFDDTNLAEAYVLARMAHAVDVKPEMPLFQQDVIKKLQGRTEYPTDDEDLDLPPEKMPRRRLVRVGGRGAA